MSIILIIGIFEVFFLLLLLVSKKRKTKPDAFLGLIFLLYGITLTTASLELYNFKNNYPYPDFLNTNWLTLFLHGPALWFYIRSLTSPSFTWKPVYLLHFMPFVLFGTAYYFEFWSLPDSEKILEVKEELFRQQPFYTITVIGIGVSTMGYNIWALQLIRKYRRNLKNYLAKMQDIDLDWLWKLCVASISIYVLNSGLFMLDIVFGLASYYFLMLLTYSFASVYVLLLGFFGLRQQNIFVDSDINQQVFHRIEEQPQAPAKSDSSAINKLHSFMEEEKPYLDPEITILKLSKQLGLKPETVSATLNSEMHQNFFDFINKYRIEEFKIEALLEENRHLSIVGLAYNCGFNSKAAFYRAFKKFEGDSPKSYIQRVSQKSETPSA